MRNRRVFALLVAIFVIAAPVSASATTRSPGALISSGHRYVTASGRYDITVRVGSHAGSQRVAVLVPLTARRSVFIPGRGHARLTFQAALTRGLLRVRAVGLRFRPEVSVAVSRAPTDSAPPGSVGRPALARNRYTKLVWSDEFAGSAGTAPSSAKWIHDVGDYGADEHEMESYTDSTANAALDGQGHLAIIARQKTPAVPGQARGYTSARLETQGLFSASFGLIEARMKIPAGTGLWPAFWMLGDNIATAGWPACGEIDVMETVGKNPFTVYGTIHGASGATSYGLQDTVTSASSLASAFHTYAVSWSPNSITWLLDGVPYGTVTRASLSPGQTWAFNQPSHLLLNLAVGGTWPGAPTPSTPFPATLSVDWVRVYQ